MPNPAPGFEKHPGHRVALGEPVHGVRVALNGRLIADTGKAILLEEDGYPPRYYLPKADVEMVCLSATDAVTHCPFKGRARYWDVQAGDARVENGAWAYDEPYDECAALAGHIAFYGERFEVTDK